MLMALISFAILPVTCPLKSRVNQHADALPGVQVGVVSQVILTTWTSRMRLAVHHSTLYLVIAEPPLNMGAVHATVKWVMGVACWVIVLTIAVEVASGERTAANGPAAAFGCP